MRVNAASILRKNWVVIRDVAQLIGVLVACFPGVEFGQLFYRQLEIDKAAALKLHKGDFDQSMVLSDIAKQDLVWWIENVGMGKKMSHGNPVIVLNTDASLTGWGAVLKDKDTRGRWTEPESNLPINALELMAVFFGLRTLCKHRPMTDTHVQILIDNITAVAHVNHMGGSHSLTCNGIGNIWLWCITRNIWISASHIPGVLNVEADKKSRLFSDQTEWKLLPEVFREVTLRLGVPDMDLFATRLNCQCKPTAVNCIEAAEAAPSAKFPPPPKKKN